MTRALNMAASIGLAALLAASPAWSDETRYHLLSEMPPFDGELRETVTGRDGATGLAFRKRIFVVDTTAYELWMHVTEASCAALPEEAPVDAGDALIVAHQYRPKDPQSFAVAAIPDIYKEVFVRDAAGDIRAYENLSGFDMAEMTERFLPVCQAL